MTPPQAQPDGTEALTERAQTLLNLGRPADALPLLHRALGRSPDDDQALCLLSVAHSDLGQTGDALAWAERAVAARPDGPWAHQLLACYLLNLGHEERSLKAARRAVRLAPEDAAGLELLGCAQLRTGDAAAAGRTARRLLSLAPDSRLTHELLTQIAVHEERWADVETHCRAALAIESNAYTSLASLGQALDKLTPEEGLGRDPGRLPEAVDCLGRATRLDPVADTARDSLGLALTRYLLGDEILWSGVLGLILLTLGILGAHFAAAFGFVGVIGGHYLGRSLRAMRTSRRRFRALPASTQQFWRRSKKRGQRGAG